MHALAWNRVEHPVRQLFWVRRKVNADKSECSTGLPKLGDEVDDDVADGSGDSQADQNTECNDDTHQCTVFGGAYGMNAVPTRFHSWTPR